MIDMNDFRYFVTIADKGSFTAAGKALGLPTSTLSYRMKKLEEKLGFTLLFRSSRQLTLTEAGAEFYRHAVATVERADDAEIAMRQRQNEPWGHLRYTTSITTAQFVMPEIVQSFLIKHPRVALSEYAADHFVDLVGERFDLAIRAHTGPLPDSDLIQRPLARISWKLFASPSYLRDNGEPSAVSDLASHATLFVRRENTQPRWSLRDADTGEAESVALSPILSSTCTACLKSAAKAGLGIASLPKYLCKKEVETGELVVVMPGRSASESALTALMPSRAGMGTGLRAFVDHVAVSCQAIIG